MWAISQGIRQESLIQRINRKNIAGFILYLEKEEMETAMERDYYLSAQEALDFGLINRIITGNGEK